MNNAIVGNFIQHYPEECAREIENFPLDDILFFFKSLSTTDTANVLSFLMPSLAAICLQNFNLTLSKTIIKQLPLRKLTTIMPRLNKPLAQALTESLPKNEQIALTHALEFSMNTVGAFMSTHVLFVPQSHNVRQTIELIKRFPEEISSWLFCIDQHHKLQGMLSLKDILIAPHATPISHIMHECPLTLPPNTAIQSIVTHTIWSKYPIIPIVDENEILLGALEYEKIIPIIQDSLFNQRKENLFDSLTHIMTLFSHTNEDLLHELNQLTSKSDK
jgi:magnesium transporter